MELSQCACPFLTAHTSKAFFAFFRDILSDKSRKSLHKFECVPCEGTDKYEAEASTNWKVTSNIVWCVGVREGKNDELALKFSYTNLPLCAFVLPRLFVPRLISLPLFAVLRR